MLFPTAIALLAMFDKPIHQLINGYTTLFTRRSYFSRAKIDLHATAKTSVLSSAVLSLNTKYHTDKTILVKSPTIRQYPSKLNKKAT
jgi:hypothetical protein